MGIAQHASSLIIKIEQLEHAFNFYFSGVDKKPPLNELNSLKKQIDRLMTEAQDSKNSAEKFLVSQIVARFTVYRTKWERGVRDIEDGRAKPGQNFFGSTAGRALNDLRNSAIEIEKKDAEAFRMNAVINETADRYIEMNRKYTGKIFSRESVSEMLEKKIDEVKKKFGDRFTFKVYFEDGKVKIKPEKE